MENTTCKPYLPGSGKALKSGLQSYVFHGYLGQDPNLEDLNCVLIHPVVEPLVQLHHLLVLSILPEKSL